ncbi:unnamed protein product [Sympodiomycopsis kandeliae]
MSSSLAGVSSLVRHGPPLVATVFLAITFFLSLFPADNSTTRYHDPAAGKFHSDANTDTSAGIGPLPSHLHNTLSLPLDVCQKEFPLLYPQLRDLRKHWGRRGISLQDLDRLESAAASQDRWGWARVVIRDGRLWIKRLFRGQDTRLSALLSQLNDVVISTENSTVLPPIDLIISSGDKEGFPGYQSGPGWVLTKEVENQEARGNWLAPDFGFKGWPEAQAPTYSEVVALQKQVESQYPWEKKDDRAFWRGFPNFYPIRRDLMDRTRSSSHAAKDSSNAWSDVFATTFGGETGPEYRPLVKLEDHCKQKYLIHSEGNSYSGRSKYLFSCNSITIAHKLRWTQHFHPALISNPLSSSQNYIQLPEYDTFSGLEETVRALWESDHDVKSPASQSLLSSNTSLVKQHHGYTTWSSIALNEYNTVDTSRNTAQKIADNAKNTLRDRYLTPAATACYYKIALLEYSKLLRYSTWPDFLTNEKGPKPKPGNGASPGKMLGSDRNSLGDISYDSWIVIGGQGDWPRKM